MNKAFLSKTSMPIVGATCGRPNLEIHKDKKQANTVRPYGCFIIHIVKHPPSP